MILTELVSLFQNINYIYSKDKVQDQPDRSMAMLALRVVTARVIIVLIGFLTSQTETWLTFT